VLDEIFSLHCLHVFSNFLFGNFRLLNVAEHDLEQNIFPVLLFFNSESCRFINFWQLLHGIVFFELISYISIDTFGFERKNKMLPIIINANDHLRMDFPTENGKHSTVAGSSPAGSI